MGSASSRRPLILVVEDDREVQSIVRDILEDDGYRVETAHNGQQGLELLVLGRIHPSLILLDLRMPILDGWDFARIIRSYHRLTDIPLIVITAPRVGSRVPPPADALLMKPFSSSSLLDLVRRHAPYEPSPAA